MTERSELQPLLFSIAYRMLGSVAEAEDVVQEALLRHERASQQGTRIEEGKPRFEVDRERQQELAGSFVEALQEGEVQRLLELLAPDVVFTGDGGGVGRGLPKPVYGAPKVSRLLAAFGGEGRSLGARLQLTRINGQPGTLNFDGE